MAPPMKLSPDDVEAVVSSYESGMTSREIGLANSVSPATIENCLHRRGIPMRPRGYPVGKHQPNGGRTTDKSGYVLISMPAHPAANSAGYVREHRLEMERFLGRYLLPDEVVHHKNGVKDDNRIENLELFASQSDHKRPELLGNQYAVGRLSSGPSARWQPEAMLQAIREFAARVGRPVNRSDLRPPLPSFRTLNRYFGDWRSAVKLATDPQPSDSTPEPSPDGIAHDARPSR